MIENKLKLNRIYNMNCFDGFKLIKTNSVSHTITSPPYNRKRNDKYKMYDDIIADYFSFLVNTIEECLRVTKGFVFFNIQKNFYNKEDVFKLIGKYSDKIVDVIIWEKSNPMPVPSLQITNAYEFILVMSKEKNNLRGNKTYTKNIFTTNVYSNNKFAKVHKAVMHPDACYYLINNFTKENDIIFDPFMGMGTTAKIAFDNNRKFIGFELSKEYYKIAKEEIICSMKAVIV